MKRYLFIANSASGTSRIRELKRLLERISLEQPEVQTALLVHHKALPLREQILTAIGHGDPDVLIACGGDGTVATVAHLASEHQLPLGILPMGTANIFSKSLGIPDTIEDALALIMAKHPTLRNLDAMECGGHLYFLHITIGLSSLISYHTPQDAKKRWGVLAYLVRLARFLGHFGLRPFHLRMDSRAYSLRANEVVIANTDIFFSRAFRLGKHITLDDGHLDLLAFAPRRLRDYVLFLLYFLTGRPQLSKQVLLMYHFTDLVVETDEPHVVMADGENIGTTPVKICLRPQALHVIVPPPPPAGSSTPIGPRSTIQHFSI